MQILPVHGLVCHRDVAMAIACLGSMIRLSAEPFSVMLHDDGSLTEEDIDGIGIGLPLVTVIRAKDADERMAEELKRYPGCAAYRKTTAMGRKLFDTPLMSEGLIRFCDSDIYFFRPFRGLFSNETDGPSAIFMQDSQEAFSLRPTGLWGSNPIRLSSRLNCGIISVRKSSYDLDFLEWLLTDRRVDFRPNYWLEQTCWSAMCHRTGVALLDPEQVVLIRDESSVTSTTIAGHFTSRKRAFLQPYLDHPRLDWHTSPVATLLTLKAGPVDRIALTKVLLRAQLSAMLGLKGRVIQTSND